MKFLVVGAGLFGSVFAHEVAKHGNKVVIVEKRNHIAGNAYTENIDGIKVHKYGAHIFHTSSKKVWDYVNQFSEFGVFVNSPLVNYKGKIYNLPFNMNTFSELWGISKPWEAKKIIDNQRIELIGRKPQNLEEQAIMLVGTDIYHKFIKGYTEKQWGKSAADLPPFIIKRIPVRFTYDNNYFNDVYQGVPKDGYTAMVRKMLDIKNIKVNLNTNFFDLSANYLEQFDKIAYTGPIDALFHYKYGTLEYRSLYFETKSLEMINFQGNAVINFTDVHVPYTRIIEHKHFDKSKKQYGRTVVTYEYPTKWDKSKEPFYPINDLKNDELNSKYQKLVQKNPKIIVGGRLGKYHYYDMDEVILEALKAAKKF